MRKIRIGFIVNNLVVGGVSKVLINLCNQLDKNSYQIHLISLSSNLKMEEILPLKEHVHKHIVEFPFSDSYRLMSYLKTAFNMKGNESRAFKILEKIKSLDLDILHFHTLPRQLFIGHLAQRQNPHLKLVYTDHLVRITDNDYRWHQKLLLTLAYRRFYRKFNLIAVSKAVYHSIKKNFLDDKDKLFQLLENSIPIINYNRTRPLKGIEKNQFIYVSRMNHHKGQNTLIEAWKKIKDPKKGKLIFIGPDESNGKFHQMAGDDPSIKFTGSISNVKDYLNDSTTAIFPSQKEGLPIALLEKMAFELPVIISDIPELTSIIENNKEGLHFRLDNIKDLQSKIEFAINNRKQMEVMGRNARLKVESICKANEPLEFHNRFYHSILKSKS